MRGNLSGLMRQQAGRRLNRRAFLAGTAATAATVAVGPRLGGRAAAAQNTDKHYKITAITFTYGDPPPTDGRGLKMINEKFNIDLQAQFVPTGSYTEKLTAVIAGGDIPDIICATGDQMPNFYKWAGQGGFLALDDLIPNYPTFKYISDPIWNNVLVNGKRYALPRYYPPYALTPSIRQDWLDNLGLKMPTSYDELKQVALAFTTGDPAKDGRDHYGIAIGANINPSYAMGAYWDPDVWYHKDDKGNYLPGLITDASKQRIQFLADLYEQGAITRDFAVMKNWADVNKEFYGNRAGIFIGAPRGMSQDYMAGLLEIAPDAKPVPIYPFKAPDGSDGFAETPGYTGITALSAKLADDADKTQRILSILDFGRQFYTDDQRNPQNADFDWYQGGEGQGYDMVDGKPVTRVSPSDPGLAPYVYLEGLTGTAWPPTDDAIDYGKSYPSQPRMAAWAAALQDMWHETDSFYSPQYGIVSPTEQEKGGDLTTFLIGEQTKMIAGQSPIDSWDDMVQQYLSMGGQQVIDETNQGIQQRDKG